jgi:hypothetical protein
MRVAAVEESCCDASTLSNSGTDFIRQREVHAYQIQANQGDLLFAIAKHQGPDKQIVVDAIASLDTTQ